MIVDGQNGDNGNNKEGKIKTFGQWLFVNGLRIVIAIATVVIVAAGAYAFIASDPNRANTVIVSILTVVSLVILTISAVTSREIVRIMANQEIEMTEQRKAMTAQADVAKQALELAKLSAKITADQLQLTKLTNRPELDVRLRMKIEDDLARVQMLFEITNVGQNTAYDFGIHICAEHHEPDYVGWLPYGVPIEAAAEPISRGKNTFIHPRPFRFEDKILFAHILLGDVWLIIYGLYWFYDGAGNRYEEAFCRRFHHLEPEHPIQCEGGLRAKIVSLVPDESKNNATD